MRKTNYFKYIAMMMVLSPIMALGFYVSPYKAYEIIGENVNIRELPNNGKVIRKISNPYVILGGDELVLDEYDGEFEDISYLGKNLQDWIAVSVGDVYLPSYQWISRKFVKELPKVPFNSSYCGSYSGTFSDDYVSSSAYVEITEKPKGWYLVKKTVHMPGVGTFPEFYAARPIHDNSHSCNFDGLELTIVR